MNQVGFLPGQNKIAVVPNVDDAKFSLMDADTNKEVFSGVLSPPRHWEMADETTRIADFSRFRTPGRYYIKVPNVADSYIFVIGEKVYDPVLAAALKAFYYNRASVALEPKYAGEFSRPAGHADTVVYMHPGAADSLRPEGTVLSSPKGWYDAGDYNKYIVNSGITMFSLLKALAQYPTVFEGVNIGIPESANGVPDLLDELMWNLDWMETMQDPNDGGVYHKLSTLRFTKPGMPHSQYQARYMIPKSTAATLDFAATMSLAARVIRQYKNAYPGHAARYEAAAKKAWHWAKRNPKRLYVQPKDVRTGAYSRPDETLADEWFWAACELYILTSEKKYLKHIDIPQSPHVPEWGHVAMLGLFSLLDHHRIPHPLAQQAKKAVVKMALEIADEYLASGYMVPMNRQNYIWGSNSVALNKAMVLIYADRFQQNANFEDAARSLLDYVLGRNPTGYSFVTGIGSKTPMNIHHRVSRSDNIEAPVPGFLVGGPQPGRQDSCTYSTSVPAKSYMDDWCSYSTNEIAINWNAPLVYVLAALR